MNITDTIVIEFIAMAKDANREKGLKNIKYFAKCLIKFFRENTTIVAVTELIVT
jgi:hypothetical protein